MRVPSRSRLVACAALSGLALAAGCGGDDDPPSNADRYDGEEAEVAGVVDDFVEAARDGDWERVCEQVFHESLMRNIERESGQSCPSEVEDNLSEDQDDYELEVDSIDVQDAAATVAVTDQDDQQSVLVIARGDSGWRIARVTPPPS
jgi:hypothetical protein